MEEKFSHAEDPEAERNLPFQTRRSLSSTSGTKVLREFDVSFLTGKNTFGQAQRLKSKKIIEQLFKEGKSVSSNGFTLVYLPAALQTYFPAQAGFSVPKRFFKRAVDRNRIKRLMREAYRINKTDFYRKLAKEKKQIAMMFVFKGKNMPDYVEVSKAVVNCMNRITP